jgi:opacity protein-like surface antigen
MSMKKTVIVLLALFVPASLWAMDIDQGKFELSGTTAFNFSDTTTEIDGAPDVDQTTWSIEFDGNYYIARNLGLGLIFQYQDSEIDAGGPAGTIESHTVFIGPQIIYHFPIGEKLSLFVKGAVGYAELEVEDADADGWGWQAGGGLKYFLTNAISVNGSVAYQDLSLDDADTDGIHVGVGLSLYF